MIRYLLLVLFLLPLAAAHDVQAETQAGPYTIQLATVPDVLEPGPANIIVSVLENNVSVVQHEVWLRLSNGNKVYLAGTFETDGTGSVSLSYLFNSPGNYELSVDVDGNRTMLPIDVHGQYLLLFGFLAAVFIVLALLMDRI